MINTKNILLYQNVILTKLINNLKKHSISNQERLIRDVASSAEISGIY